MNAAFFTRLEEQLLAPAVRKDKARLEALLAEDFVEFASSGGRYTRAEVIAALSAENPVERSLDHLEVRELAAGLTLVTYRAARVDRDTGAISHSLQSSIWRKADGNWQMIFHQGTSQP